MLVRWPAPHPPVRRRSSADLILTYTGVMPADTASTTLRVARSPLALKLVETILPGADANAACATVDDWLEHRPAARAALASGLRWLDMRALATIGRRFGRATPAQRQTVIARLSRTAVSAHLLRAVAAPFKAAWLLDDKVQTRLGSRPRVQVPTQVERFRWQAQITRADDLEGDQELEADVVVVGTGAGGAAAAYELASRGLAVVMLEEGEYLDRSHFTGNVAEMIPRLYRSLGLTTALGNVLMPVPVGRSVGGTTTVNSGTCMRTPPEVLRYWREQRGLGAFTDAAMHPWFDAVEDMLGVQRAEPRFVGPIAEVIGEGARRLGFERLHPLLRNAPGCDGQGLCQFGCPTDAKRSTNVSYVPRALERGAFLFTGTRVTELVREGRRVRGVRAEARDRLGRRIVLTVRATRTVIAMGSLFTPLFLRRNGIRNPHLGRHLTLHPCGVVNGIFPDRDFRNSRTIPQGFGVADLAERGIMFEGGTLPLLGHGLLSDLYGADFVRACEDYRHTAWFGFMLRDTSEGEVRRGLHRNLPSIRYHMNDADFARFREALELLGRMYFAAGAREVVLPGPLRHHRVHDERALREVVRSARRPRDFLMSAYHPLGTARIAATPEQGVCDDRHQVFGWDGLHVIDGSSVPTALGANPQITIMAMAARAAALMADELVAAATAG